MRPPALLMALILAAAIWPGSAAGAASPPPTPAAAASVLARLEPLRDQVRAYCDLAGKAAPRLPALARGYLRRALAAADDLRDPAALALARDLILAGGRANLAAAEELRAMAGGVWPYRLVAEGALPLDRQLATLALTGAQEAAASDDAPLDVAWEVGGLVPVLARRDPARARELAGTIRDPRVRSWALREMFKVRNWPVDGQAAARVAQKIADSAQRAVSLARCARLLQPHLPRESQEIFARAWEAAAEVEPPRSERVKAKVAAWWVEASPAEGLKRAAELEGWGPYLAQRQGLTVLSEFTPPLRRALVESALASAAALPPGYERLRGRGRLAEDLAYAEPRAAQDLSAGLAGVEPVVGGGARAAVLLALAAGDPAKAESLAKGLRPRELSLYVRARLAARAPGQAADLDALGAEVGEAAREGGAYPAALLLAPVWAPAAPARAAQLAQALAEPRLRVAALTATAAALARAGRSAAAEWCLTMAITTIKGLENKERLDKVAWLGHMGREWADLDARRALSFFEMGARLAEKWVEPSGIGR